MDAFDWYGIFVRMVACSIIVHDALYICRDGKVYLTNCIAPTFGLYLNPWQKLVVHGGLFASCIVMMVLPFSVFAYPICLCFLTLKIASYSLRLANHMIFAWFLLVLLCVASVRGGGAISDYEIALVALTTQKLVLMLYFFSFFHKLNKEYFSLKSSCSVAFVDFFCADRQITNPSLVQMYRHISVYGTIVIEGAIPILLCIDSTRMWGLLLGIAFHFTLALLGIINFSIFMYTGLLAFVPLTRHNLWTTSSWNIVIFLIGCLFVLLIVWRYTPRKASQTCSYRYRRPAWIIQTAFGVLTSFFLFVCMRLIQQELHLQEYEWKSLHSGDMTILAIMLTAFFLNGIGPYLGYKTEFSFAMFSNLRLDPWSHFLIPASLRIFKQSPYIEIKAISGLPASEAVKGNKAAELALHLLSKPTQYFYSRYFFREALRTLAASALAPKLFVGYIERGSYREISMLDVDLIGYCLPINRFPFVMPRDPHMPHSEQGSIVTQAERKQLF